jgi:hypothetical protein
MDKNISFKAYKSENAICEFLERIWLLQNPSTKDKLLIAIPDGRVDILFTSSPNKPFRSAI